MAHHLSRRQLLGGIATALLSSQAIAADRSFATIAGANGIRFGSAVRAASLDDPVIAKLLARECGTLTPELEWKWAAVAPAPDRHDWVAADRVAGFARAHDMRVRGHTLVWHGSIPDWAAAMLESDADWRPIAGHIRSLVGRYHGLVDEWDVVNEPIEIGRRDDGLRESPFLLAFGRDYIARAFHDAHAAAPRARLVLNEYGVEYATPEHRARRDALLGLVRSLVERGVPIHGVGVQAHLDLNMGSIDALGLRRFMASLASLGLGVSITELDVKERDYVLPAVDRDRLVAEHVATFLATVLPGRSVRSLTCWGLSDRQSWLEVTAADRARFPGAWADGSSPGVNRGLPFDTDGSAKPMRDAIAQALAAVRG